MRKGFLGFLIVLGCLMVFVPLTGCFLDDDATTIPTFSITGPAVDDVVQSGTVYVYNKDKKYIAKGSVSDGIYTAYVPVSQRENTPFLIILKGRINDKDISLGTLIEDDLSTIKTGMEVEKPIDPISTAALGVVLNDDNITTTLANADEYETNIDVGNISNFGEALLKAISVSGITYAKYQDIGSLTTTELATIRNNLFGTNELLIGDYNIAVNINTITNTTPYTVATLETDLFTLAGDNCFFSVSNNVATIDHGTPEINFNNDFTFSMQNFSGLNKVTGEVKTSLTILIEGANYSIKVFLNKLKWNGSDRFIIPANQAANYIVYDSNGNKILEATTNVNNSDNEYLVENGVITFNTTSPITNVIEALQNGIYKLNSGNIYDITITFNDWYFEDFNGSIFNKIEGKFKYTGN